MMMMRGLMNIQLLIILNNFDVNFYIDANSYYIDVILTQERVKELCLQQR